MSILVALIGRETLPKIRSIIRTSSIRPLYSTSPRKITPNKWKLYPLHVGPTRSVLVPHFLKTAQVKLDFHRAARQPPPTTPTLRQLVNHHSGQQQRPEPASNDVSLRIIINWEKEQPQRLDSIDCGLALAPALSFDSGSQERGEGRNF